MNSSDLFNDARRQRQQRERRRRRIWINATALLLASTTIALYLVNIDNSRRLHLGALAPLPAPQAMSANAFAEKITMKRFTEDGMLDHKLLARHINFYQGGSTPHRANGMPAPYNRNMSHSIGDDNGYLDSEEGSSTTRDYAEIEAPHFFLYDKNTLALSLSAKRAELLNDGEDLQFYEHVQVKDFRSQTNLDTSELLVSTVLHQAMSQQKVTITSPTSKTEATGLHAHLDQQLWQLVSEVKSVVQP